jgi:hypothetical protein
MKVFSLFSTPPAGEWRGPEKTFGNKYYLGDWVEKQRQKPSLGFLPVVKSMS